MQEFDIIKTYFEPLSAAPLDNDTASLHVPDGHELVVSTDMLNEGVHFTREMSAAFVAQKALRVNLSDLAASGAAPLAYQLAISLPEVDKAWLAEFAKGLKADQEKYGIALSGGDTTKGPLAMTITIFGTVPKGCAVERSGAREGDVILLSGPIGEAVSKNYNHLPEPQIHMSDIVQQFAHAAIDVSDGLLQDVGHLAEASGLCAKLRIEDIPLYEGGPLTPEQMLVGGEDFQLVMACAPENAAYFEGCTQIGVCAQGQGVELLGVDGIPIEISVPGWDHFRK